MDFGYKNLTNICTENRVSDRFVIVKESYMIYLPVIPGKQANQVFFAVQKDL